MDDLPRRLLIDGKQTRVWNPITDECPPSRRLSIQPMVASLRRVTRQWSQMTPTYHYTGNNCMSRYSSHSCVRSQVPGLHLRLPTFPFWLHREMTKQVIGGTPLLE